MKSLLFSVLLLLSMTSGLSVVCADSFGSGDNAFEIEFVPIGNPGNADDLSGRPTRPFVIDPCGRCGPPPGPVGPGAVDYQYRMGKFEISEQMIEKANALGNLGITKDTLGSDKPATSIDWFEAARFVNWLNESTGHIPAYKFDAGGNFQLWEPGDAGYSSRNLFRNNLARYVLPSVDEWYKAAYFDPATGTWFDYPTGSNDPPIAVASGTDPGTAVYHEDISAGPADIFNAGGLSPFGTMAQGGNVSEWHETALDLHNNNAAEGRRVRGGFWYVFDASGLNAAISSDGFPSIPYSTVGFRVASIPEPSTLLLAVLGLFSVMRFRQRATE